MGILRALLRLSASVETCDSVEVLVEARHSCTLRVGLEPIKNDLLDVHPGPLVHSNQPACVRETRHTEAERLDGFAAKTYTKSAPKTWLRKFSCGELPRGHPSECSASAPARALVIVWSPQQREREMFRQKFAGQSGAKQEEGAEAPKTEEAVSNKPAPKEEGLPWYKRWFTLSGRPPAGTEV